ncbi:MAG: hypothetical protein ACQEVA_02050 [Myxococcota bacterium]
MTKHTPSGPLASLFSSRGLKAAALGLIGSAALAVSGCDTVAQISFTERGFNSIESSGFVPSGGGFDGSVDACNGTSGNMTMRFVMTDTRNRPIRLGEDQIENQSVELDNSSVNFSEDALFEIPQETTTLGDLTDVRESPTCTTGATDACETPGFGCGTAPSIPQDSRYNACFSGGGVTLRGGTGERVRFVSSVDTSKLFGVAYEVSGSVVGAQPTLSDNPNYDPMGTNVFWDQDGDGNGDVEVDPGSFTTGVASDPDESRGTSVSQMLSSYLATETTVTEGGRQIALGGWHFNESAPVTALEDRAWSTGREGAASTIQSLSTVINGRRDFAGTHAEVYGAAQTIIENNYTDDAISNIPRGDSMLEQGVDKVLVLVVDGPDDTRDSLDDLIQTARDNQVRLFIVHYDTPFDADITGQLYDLPEYLTPQTSGDACTDDSDCKNFETCRQFKGFSSAAGEATKGVPDDSYCFPQRDTDGRVGPIEDYSRLACATGGGYIYLRSPYALPRATEWLPYTTEGLWEVEVSSDGVNDLSGKQDLLMQTLFDVTVSGTNKTYQFSQVGGRTTGGANATIAVTDTRSAIFTAE